MTPIRRPNQGDVEAYWKFICNIPAPQNPILDATGETALGGREDSKDLIYLSGSNGAIRNRSIVGKIPSGRELFIAVNPVVVTEPEAGTNNTANLTKFAKEDEDSATSAKLTIDGQLYDLIPNNRVPTGPFEVTFPDNAIFRAPKGTFPAVADGYYAIIDGLPTGEHIIEIDAGVTNPFKGFNEPSPWEDKVTYKIKI